MHESFFTVAKHFPHHRPLIQSLVRSSPVFRETCMDYHKCGEALQHWLESDSDQAVMRVTEYEELLQSLELEILYYLKKPDRKNCLRRVNKKQ